MIFEIQAALQRLYTKADKMSIRKGNVRIHMALLVKLTNEMVELRDICV